MKVFIVAAISADGLLGASVTQSSMEWRSREDGKSFNELTRTAGVMIMGSATYQTFRVKRAPPGRKLVIYTHHPESIQGEGDIEATAEAPAALLARLEQAGYTSVALCGGATIHSLFLEAELVDDLYLTIEPVLFGQGVPLFRAPTMTRLELVSCDKLNNDTLLLHYVVQK